MKTLNCPAIRNSQAKYDAQIRDRWFEQLRRKQSARPQFQANAVRQLGNGHQVFGTKG